MKIKTRTEIYLSIMRAAASVAEAAEIIGEWVTFKAIKVAVWAEDRAFPKRYVELDEATDHEPGVMTIAGDMTSFRDPLITVLRGSTHITVFCTVTYHTDSIVIRGVQEDDRVQVTVFVGREVVPDTRHFVFDPDHPIVDFEMGYTAIGKSESNVVGLPVDDSREP